MQGAACPSTDADGAGQRPGGRLPLGFVRASWPGFGCPPFPVAPHRCPAPRVGGVGRHPALGAVFPSACEEPDSGPRPSTPRASHGVCADGTTKCSLCVGQAPGSPSPWGAGARGGLASPGLAATAEQHGADEPAGPRGGELQEHALPDHAQPHRRHPQHLHPGEWGPRVLGLLPRSRWGWGSELSGRALRFVAELSPWPLGPGAGRLGCS